ncbi:MAG: hypothetical protein A3H24_11405 [Rhodoferax sp. RIFCSPLOWO2_12_FULL_60_11]|nr:MAG: hypothetical protein A3H24_11405 [Rhodoferax sp. RIFCSPLOWO2_12_FULL_60_11]
MIVPLKQQPAGDGHLARRQSRKRLTWLKRASKVLLIIGASQKILQTSLQLCGRKHCAQLIK